MELATGTDVRNGWEAQLLDLDAIEHYWPAISSLLSKVPHTWKDWTLESLHQRALERHVQIWALGKSEIRATVFTQIAIFPAHRVLEVILMTGTGALESFEILDAMLSKFAEEQDCEEIHLHARPGFKPLVEARGFKQTSIIFSRPVKKERMQ